jgi:hypothetical protein
VKAAGVLASCACAWACAAASAAGTAQALLEEVLDVEGPGHWRFAAAPGMLHFNPNPQHRPVWAVALERQRDDRWLYGGSYFSNSFGQDSGYLYLGRQYPGVFDRPQLFAQWSAGLLYGYKGTYRDKVPLNYKAFSPGAVVSLGWRFDPRSSMQINLVGTAGLMLQLSHDWP